MLKPIRFTVVEMSGSRYQMGWHYGKRCRGLIRRLVEHFDNLLVPEGLRAEAREVAMSALPIVEHHAPELVEEVRGIADGAGVDFSEVFRLSCSQEINSWQGCQRQRVETTVADQCTSFALRQGGCSLVGWNMDWWTPWQRYLVLLHGQPDDGPRFLCFALAGSVGRPGLSERVALGANFLPYRANADTPVGSCKWAGPGVPYSFLSRILVAQPSTAAALKLLRRIPRMACLNYTLGDINGDICCVETLPQDLAVLRPPAGEDFIVHANSYHARKFGGLTEAQQEEKDPRAWLARQTLRTRTKPLGRADLYAVQRRHFPGQNTGVCVHTGGQQPSITLLGYVGDLSEQAIWAAWGPPCQHRFLRYGL